MRKVGFLIVFQIANDKSYQKDLFNTRVSRLLLAEIQILGVWSGGRELCPLPVLLQDVGRWGLSSPGQAEKGAGTRRRVSEMAKHLVGTQGDPVKL